MKIIAAEDLYFEVNLLFKESKNAIDAFNQMVKFYEALNDFDKVIARNINQYIITEYQLEDLEFGGVKTTLSQLVKTIPEDQLTDELKNSIGLSLIKIKYWVSRFLTEHREITSNDEIQKITDRINEEIRKIGTEKQLIVTQVSNYAVLNAIDDLVKEINTLKEKELLEYKSAAGSAFTQKGIYINKPKILSELGQRTIINETTELLKIKRIDMLSESPKWDFLQGKKMVAARMLDKEWLEAFHHREVSIKPEDALMVTLKTTHTYNPNFDDKRTDCEVIKVQQIVSPETENVQQLAL